MRTGTEPRGTPILRDLRGEDEPVKLTEKQQAVRLEETRRVWYARNHVKTVT